MSLRTLRGKGVYCGVQVHTSQPRDQPNTVARILILTCQIVVGSMTGGAACSSIQHFWGSLDFSDILEDKNNKCWFTTRSSCGFSHWTKVWQNLVAIWSHHFQAGWSCLKKGPNSPIRLLDSPMVNLSMGKPTHQYSKFRKSLSLFSFRFISVAALWWPAKSCEFPTDPMARRAARRWRLPGAQGSPWDPSRCSHGFCLRTQRIELILLKNYGAVGWLIWWFHWKVRRATPISPTWWKLWCDSGNWAKGQRIEGTRAFMRVSFPDMILYHQTQNWLIGVKTPETVRPDKKPLLVTCFSTNKLNHRQWGYRQSLVVRRNNHCILGYHPICIICACGYLYLYIILMYII